MGEFHGRTLHLYQVGDFAYFISLVANDDWFIICIKFVLLVGWVDPLSSFVTYHRR